MTIVIDTNIVISAILSDKGKIGELLLSKTEKLEFFAPEFLLDELNNHQSKIKSIAGFNDDEYERVIKLVLKTVVFVDESSISPGNLNKAFEMVKDVDLKDLIFVALCLEKNCVLWTGDKKLIKGFGA